MQKKYEYNSSEIFLKSVQAEYQNEISRISVLDSKLNLSLPVISTYFFLVIQRSNLKELYNYAWEAESNSVFTIRFLDIVAYSIAIVLAIVSLGYTIHAALIHSYKVVDVRQFNNPAEMSVDKNQYSAVISTYYIRAMEINVVQNDERARKYVYGWRFAIASLFCFVTHVLFFGIF